MKKFLLGLVCAALASPAWGQSPVSIETAPPGGASAAQVAPKTPAIQEPVARVAAADNACAPACQPVCKVPCAARCAPRCGPVCAPKCRTCAEELKTICVPVASTRIKVTINYSSGCDKVCFPKCNFFGGGCGCDTGCGQAACGHHTYNQGYLIKRVCKEELPTTKCVPITVSACDAQQYATPGIIQTQPARVTETIPVAPMKK